MSGRLRHCRDCGALCSPDATRCRPCNNKAQKQGSAQKPPSNGAVPVVATCNARSASNGSHQPGQSIRMRITPWREDELGRVREISRTTD
jgi:hypothetical protein